MVVDLLGFPKMDDHTAIQEATSQGLRSMEHLICFMSNWPNHMDCSDLIDHIVAKFKKVISLLNRTDHARFRRKPIRPSASPSSFDDSIFVPHSQTLNLAPTPPAPVVAPIAMPHISITALVSYVSHSQSLTLDFTNPNAFASNTKASELDYAKDSFSMSSSSSLSLAIFGDRSLSLWKALFSTRKWVTLLVDSLIWRTRKSPSFGSRFCRRRPISNRVLWF